MSRRARISIVLGLIVFALVAASRLGTTTTVPTTAAIVLGLVILAGVIWWL
jgi:hypothetical protein